MSRLLLIVLVFLATGLFSQSLQDIYTCGFVKHQQRILASKSVYRSSAAQSSFDLKYHRCEWNVSPNKYFVSGVITSHFTFTAPTNKMHFDFGSFLTLDSVTQRGVRIPAIVKDRYIEITFPNSYTKGDFDSVSVVYHGNPTAAPGRFFFIEGHQTGKVLATQSEPYGASEWWPCKEGLADKFDSVDVIITTDKGFLAGGPGLLVENYQINDSQMRYHWQHRYPCPTYLVGIVVSNFKAIRDSVLLYGNQMPLLHYVYPHSVARVTPLLKITPRLLQVFDSAFGTYPYINEKYGHMQWNVGGGMEHATMSSMGDFDFNLMAHESAHQWFGNKVTCNSWQDIWLNESFATYLNALAYDFLFKKEDFIKQMGGILERAKSNNSLSIFVEDTTSVGRIFNQDLSYQKGAMVLHTLRYMIGDDAFFTGCRNYLADPELAYGSANTSQLIAHFQALTDIPLTPFFSSFFYGKGYPTYLIRWQQKGTRITFEINQSTTNPATDFFPHTIPLHVYSNGLEHVFPLEITANEMKKEINFQGQVDDIVFNKNNQVLASGTVAKISNSISEEFTIMPNPSDGKFIILSNKKPIKSIYVVNSIGQNVVVYQNINDYSVSIDLGTLHAQQLILRIETEEGFFIKRYTKYK